jgi:hypothetical protein
MPRGKNRRNRRTVAREELVWEGMAVKVEKWDQVEGPVDVVVLVGWALVEWEPGGWALVAWAMVVWEERVAMEWEDLLVRTPNEC